MPVRNESRQWRDLFNVCASFARTRLRFAKERAEDAGQDALHTLLREQRLGRHDMSRGARPFLRCVVRRQAVTEFRKQGVRTARQAELQLAMEPSAAALGAEVSAFGYEAIRLLAAMPALPREVWLLRKLEECSVGEISAALKLPERTIYRHLRSAECWLDRHVRPSGKERSLTPVWMSATYARTSSASPISMAQMLGPLSTAAMVLVASLLGSHCWLSGQAEQEVRSPDVVRTAAHPHPAAQRVKDRRGSLQSRLDRSPAESVWPTPPMASHVISPPVTEPVKVPSTAAPRGMFGGAGADMAAPPVALARGTAPTSVAKMVFLSPLDPGDVHYAEAQTPGPQIGSPSEPEPEADPEPESPPEPQPEDPPEPGDSDAQDSFGTEPDPPQPTCTADVRETLEESLVYAEELFEEARTQVSEGDLLEAGDTIARAIFEHETVMECLCDDLCADAAIACDYAELSLWAGELRLTQSRTHPVWINHGHIVITSTDVDSLVLDALNRFDDSLDAIASYETEIGARCEARLRREITASILDAQSDKLFSPRTRPALADFVERHAIAVEVKTRLTGG